MQLSDEGKLYNIFEEKLVEISERVGYGGEEVSSEKHRVFEEAWDFYLRDLGVSRTMEYPAAGWVHGWHPMGPRLSSFVDKGEVFLVSDPLYTTGNYLEVQKALALKILTLGGLP